MSVRKRDPACVIGDAGDIQAASVGAHCKDGLAETYTKRVAREDAALQYRDFGLDQ